MYRVILTWEAVYDITDIAEYIEVQFGKERADRFQEDIRSQIKSLEFLGGISGKTSIIIKNLFVYKKLFLPSIIFYIIDESQNRIYVLRVLREERNWKKYSYRNLITRNWIFRKNMLAFLYCLYYAK